MKKFFSLKYFLLVIAIAILLTVIAILLINDAFAITAPSDEVTVTIPESSTKSEVARILKENGIIKSRTWFSVYTALRGKEVTPKGDTYVIPKNSGFDAICRILAYGSSGSNTEIRVAIPEGSSIEGIMEIVCDQHGICSRQEFINTVQNGNFSGYSFVKHLDQTKNNRKYRLEGYLYPDTYCFYSKSSAYAVIDKMLANFATKVDKRYIAAAEKQGMTLDEAVTLGSIIMREGKFISDMPKISSVFHNRLKSPSFSYRLQSDATVVYALGREMQSEDKELDDPYNTYKYGGLPPSPICCPDLNAISYAIYPDSTGYYYFVTKKDGTVLYARDYQTHLNNIKKNQE